MSVFNYVAAVTVCSDFGAKKKNQISYIFVNYISTKLKFIRGIMQAAFIEIDINDIYILY